MTEPATGTRRSRATTGGAVSSALAVLAMVVMIPAALLIVGVWLAGWQFAVVRTGSMAPGMPAGSLAVLSPVAPGEVEVGTVIEFMDPDNGNRLVTHRVIEVQRGEGGELFFQTKGDFNDAEDTYPVPAANVRGEVRWHVSGLGRLLVYLQPPWSLMFVVAPFLLVMGARAMRDPEDRPAGPVARGRPGAAVLACVDCPAAVEPHDRYCRRCGARQLRESGHRELVAS